MFVLLRRLYYFFFYNLKTAYEVRMSDWSSDVCSSDLMGDDQRNDYIYKFVSDNTYQEGGDNSSLLDAGKLYVAKFNDGAASGNFMGTGEWVLLDKAANTTLAASDEFKSQAEVLIHARLAADAVGATKMDRPERVSVHPGRGDVYVRSEERRVGKECVSTCR